MADNFCGEKVVKTFAEENRHDSSLKTKDVPFAKNRCLRLFWRKSLRKGQKPYSRTEKKFGKTMTIGIDVYSTVLSNKVEILKLGK